MSPPLLKFLVVAVVAIILYWSFLFLLQRKVMFPAPITFGAPDIPPDSEQVWLESEAGKTEAWFLAPLNSAGSPSPLLIFGHGNGELIDYWPAEFEEPRSWGVAVLLVEYPGYGRSDGSPSEAGIGAAFRAAYDWAVTQKQIDAKKIVGYGRSLGGGAVTNLSRDRDLAAMILESSFTSTRAFARRMGAPGFLVRDPFDNLDRVKTYKGSLLVIHGKNDSIIPIAHGQALAEAGGVTLHKLNCGHNDCPRSWRLIRDFLNETNILPGDKSITSPTSLH